MEPITAATAMLLRRDAAISTEKSASLVVIFTQEMWRGEEKEGEVLGLGLGEELGDNQVVVATGGDDEMVRQTRYSVAGSRWVKLYSWTSTGTWERWEDKGGRERWGWSCYTMSPPAEVGSKLLKVTCYPSFTRLTSLAKLVTLKKSGLSL